MGIDTQEQLVKIIAEFQDEDGVSSVEGLRAISLGNSLYEIRNIPMFASGLHLFDVVRCEESHNEENCPTVIEVVTPSNYKTIGIIFSDRLNDEQQGDVIWSLYNQIEDFHYARATETNCAVTFPVDDYMTIVSQLNSYQEEGQITLFEDLE